MSPEYAELLACLEDGETESNRICIYHFLKSTRITMEV